MNKPKKKPQGITFTGLTPNELRENSGYNRCWDDREKWLKSKQMSVEEILSMKNKKFIDYASEMVHKAYCAFKKEKDNEEYWTKGNWNLLDEKWKEADRYTVRAVLEAISKRIRGEG